MENKASFVLGLLVLILAGLSIFFSIGGRFHLHKVFLISGVLININAGILLLLGGIWNSRSLEGSGFGIGMAAWIMMILSSVWGILWYINEINFANMFNMIIILMLLQSQIYFIVTIPTIIYTVGLMTTIIILCFGAACIVLGSIAFGILIERTKY